MMTRENFNCRLQGAECRSRAKCRGRVLIITNSGWTVWTMHSRKLIRRIAVGSFERIRIVCMYSTWTCTWIIDSLATKPKPIGIILLYPGGNRILPLFPFPSPLSPLPSPQSPTPLQTATHGAGDPRPGLNKSGVSLPRGRDGAPRYQTANPRSCTVQKSCTARCLLRSRTPIIIASISQRGW